MNSINPNPFCLFFLICLTLFSCKNEAVRDNNSTSLITQEDTNNSDVLRITHDDTINSEIEKDIKDSNKNRSNSSDSVRIIGGIRMKPNLGGGFISLNINGYYYTENYPLIIKKSEVQGSSAEAEEIIFFEDENKIQKVLDIKEINPFVDKYDNIEYKFPSSEYYEKASDSLISLYERDKIAPINYFTIAPTAIVQSNGFSFASYDLIPVLNHQLLAWKSKILIFDRKGNIIHEIDFSKMTYPISVSNNGQLLVVLDGYEGFSFIKRSDCQFSIIDLNTAKEILGIPTPEGYRPVNAGPDPTNRFVNLNYTTYSKTARRFVSIIDLKDRKLYTGKLDFEDYMLFSDNNTFVASQKLLEKFDFQITNF